MFVIMIHAKRLTLEVCGLGISEGIDSIIGLVDLVHGGDVLWGSGIAEGV